MSILDPKADAAALQPVIDEAIERAAGDLRDKVLPVLAAALSKALVDGVDGLTITIQFSKKVTS